MTIDPSPIPAGMESCRLPTDWVRDGIRPFFIGPGTTVRSFLPPFPSAARILHPAHLQGGGPIDWASVAALSARPMSPVSRWESIARDPRVVEPEPGRLAEEVVEPILAVLARHTSARDRCAFGIWNGYGSLAQRHPGVPRLVLPNRTYLMFEGPLEAVMDLVFGDPGQPPNIWWPGDRAWCVATDIDAHSTYVGGSRECVAALLDTGLEAFRVSVDARVDRDETSA